jgi:hypothetical protein
VETPQDLHGKSEELKRKARFRGRAAPAECAMSLQKKFMRALIPDTAARGSRRLF